MKQKRKMKTILIFLMLFLAIIGFGYPAYTQNKFLYSYFKDLLNAVQQQDKSKVEQYYKDTKNILPEYWQQMFKYKMLGWKINSISGQPWPLDDDLEYKKVEVSLYYSVSGNIKIPENGKMVNHPKFGHVLEVSTICRFIPQIYANKGTEVSLMLPGQGISTNWLAPYEGK